MRFLPQAYKNGDDLLAREKVHNASCLAGMAFNTAGLGICHSIAHTIGGKFHISHGRANALVLPHVIAFNADTGACEKTLSARKYQRMSKLIGLPYANTAVAVNSLIRRIEEMKRAFGIPDTLKRLDVDPEAVKNIKDEMVQAALADTCTATNPRAAGTEDIEAILSEVTPF